VSGPVSEDDGSNPSSCSGGSESRADEIGEPVITPSLVLKAYSVGLFPMGQSADDSSLVWIDPDNRGVIPIDEAFTVSRSLRKALRTTKLSFTTDTSFPDVMAACAAPSPGRWSTWINEPIRHLYCSLHEQGFAHSVECWEGNAVGKPTLVGGLYGVSMGGAFFGESMFSLRTNASKMCLVALVGCLRECGFRLLDAQFITDHLRQFGAEEIPRAEYQRRLAAALQLNCPWPAPGPLTSDFVKRGDYS
jgi:leucyl/phenylalanyl-tRNA---protein transferase